MKNAIFRISVAIAAISAFLYFLFGYLPYSIIVSKNVNAIAKTVLIVVGLASILSSVIRPPVALGTPAKPVVLLTVGLCLTLPFAFMAVAFGTMDVGSLLSAFQENQVGDLLGIGIAEFSLIAFELAWKALLLLVCAYFTVKTARFGRFLVVAAATILIVFGSIPFHVYRSMMPSPAHAAIAPELVNLDPVILKRPRQKKNLVMIYMESFERTYGQIESVDREYSFFRELEEAGLTFTNVDQLAGTGFTIAGMVASQCGVPLVPKGALNILNKTQKRVDIMPDTSNFMSKTICLGDILSDDGYNLNYINGSKLSIYGKGDFYTSHGYSKVVGLSSFPEWETDLRTNNWGMDDDLLFERATDLLRELANAEQPFVLSVLTIATHGPKGFPDARCAPDADPEAENLLPQAIACTAQYVGRFLAEIEALAIADDTLILLTSDHLAWKNTMSPELREFSRQRRNFVTLLGTEQQARIERSGTMIDLYPTLLEVLGYSLEGGKAGLGVSLLSDGQTLVERLGIENADAAILYNYDLRRIIWR